jgi:hypothetical protein
MEIGMVIRSPDEVDLSKVKINPHPYWAPTTAYGADNCMKAYALKLFKVDYEIPAAIAKGSLIHSLLEREKFWKERGGVFVPFFKSDESFSNVVGGNWKRIRKDGKSTNSRKPAERRSAKTIRWRNDAERWGPRTLEDVMHMARMAYRTESERGPPIETEVDFKVCLTHPSLPDVLKGLRLKGHIDYIRAPMVLGDHKTGYASMEGNFLSKNFQLIHYALSTWQALHDPKTILFQKHLPKYRGIPLDEFLEIAQVEVNHIPSTQWTEDISQRPEKSNVYSANVRLNDMVELGKILRNLEDLIAQRKFMSRADRKDCNRCFYGDLCDKFDMEEIFADEYAKRNPLFAFFGTEQGFFGRPEKPKTLGRQKTMRLMKATNEFKF